MISPPFPLNISATKFAAPAKIAGMAKAGRRAIPLKSYPNRLRAVRESLGLSLEQVAEAISRVGGPPIKHQTLQKYEIGVVRLTVPDLERIAKAMNVPAPLLLNSVDPVEDEQERAALSVFRRLSPADRERALRMMTSLLPDEPRRQAVS